MAARKRASGPRGLARRSRAHEPVRKRRRRHTGSRYLRRYGLWDRRARVAWLLPRRNVLPLRHGRLRPVGSRTGGEPVRRRKDGGCRHLVVLGRARAGAGVSCPRTTASPLHRFDDRLCLGSRQPGADDRWRRSLDQGPTAGAISQSGRPRPFPMGADLDLRLHIAEPSPKRCGMRIAHSRDGGASSVAVAIPPAAFGRRTRSRRRVHRSCRLEPANNRSGSVQAAHRLGRPGSLDLEPAPALARTSFPASSPAAPGSSGLWLACQEAGGCRVRASYHRRTADLAGSKPSPPQVSDTEGSALDSKLKTPTFFQPPGPMP